MTLAVEQRERDLVIRELRDHEVAAAVALVGDSLGEGAVPRTEAFWRWKHEQNPFGRSPTLVAEADGEIIGLRAFLRWTWRLGTTSVPAVRAVDTATASRHRGKGVFSKLTLALVDRMVREGVHFVFNTPNERSRPGYLKMGWRTLGRVSLLVSPRRPMRLLVGAIRARRGTPSPSRPLADTAGRTVAELLENVDVERFSTSESAGRPDLRTLPEPAYLTWRYRDVPGIEYRSSWDARGGEAAACIFRSAARSGLRELRISQLLVGSDRKGRQLGTQLVRDTLAEADPDLAVAMAAPGTPERAALRAAGFVPAPSTGPIMTVRDLSRPAPTRHEMACVVGDLELF